MPAWWKRQSEHQDFVGEWTRMMFKESEEFGEVFFPEVAVVLLEFLAYEYEENTIPRSLPRSIHLGELSEGSLYNAAWNFCRNLIKASNEFSRSGMERNKILSCFLEKVTGSVIQHFRSAALREEFENPTLILRARSVSEDVSATD